MLLTPPQLIVSRLTLINSGVVKMSITTMNLILPTPETEVSVINSFHLILQYNTIRMMMRCVRLGRAA